MKIQIPYRCHNVHGCIEVSGEMTSKQETFPTEMYSTQGNYSVPCQWRLTLGNCALCFQYKLFSLD